MASIIDLRSRTNHDFHNTFVFALRSNSRSLMAMQRAVPSVFDIRSISRATASAAYSLAYTVRNAQRSEPDSTRPAAIHCTNAGSADHHQCRGGVDQEACGVAAAVGGLGSVAGREAALPGGSAGWERLAVLKILQGGTSM